MTTKKQRCEARTFPPGPGVYGGVQCHNTAVTTGKDWGKVIPLCRVHDPVAQEERRKRGGPTAWERQLAAADVLAQRQARRASALRGLLDAAREVAERLRWIGYEQDKSMKARLNAAIKAAEEALDA